MAISSISPSISPPTSTPSSDSAASALVQGAQKNLNQHSTVVSLSQQGQQLSQTDNPSKTNQAQTSNKVDTVTAENVKAKAEPPGIQFMEGESKRGRVNTYA